MTSPRWRLLTWDIVSAVGVLAAALAFSYTMAKAGEPQSAWVWCTILRMC